MQRQNILAHRGCWTDPSHKNSKEALHRALAEGFGVETDFRDLDGQLVIAHDPPRQGCLDADWFFGLYGALKATGRLALNVKADGLQGWMAAALDKAGIARDRAYAFDMAVPDALGYLAQGFPAYTRISEYERAPSFLDQAAGLWVDNFSGDFAQVEAAAQFLAKGHRVAFVSPELHGRIAEPIWDEIRKAGLHQEPGFELCTDLPLQACEFFEVSA